MPSRPIAPAPPSALSAVPKVSGPVTVTMESGLPQASAIPVATISGQQVSAMCCIEELSDGFSVVGSNDCPATVKGF